MGVMGHQAVAVQDFLEMIRHDWRGREVPIQQEVHAVTKDKREDGFNSGDMHLRAGLAGRELRKHHSHLYNKKKAEQTKFNNSS